MKFGIWFSILTLFSLNVSAADLAGRYATTDRQAVFELKYPDFWRQTVVEFKGKKVEVSQNVYDSLHSQPVLTKFMTGEYTITASADSPSLLNMDVTVQSEELQKKAESKIFYWLKATDCFKGGYADLMQSGCGRFPKTSKKYFFSIIELDPSVILVSGSPLARPDRVPMSPLKKGAK